MPLLLGHDRPTARVIVLVGISLVWRIPREHDLVTRRVPCIRMIKASNNGKFVHHLRAFWKKVANLYAGHVGGHRAERATVILRGIGFRVPSLVLTGPSALPQYDDGLLLGSLCRIDSTFGLQYLGQGKARHAQGACLDETTPVNRKVSSKLFATECVGLH